MISKIPPNLLNIVLDWSSSSAVTIASIYPGIWVYYVMFSIFVMGLIAALGTDVIIH
jgi:hypothetical protein